MHQNFSIGVGAEILVAILDELFFERLIIFDDAVVNESDLAGGVEMRMRVFVVDLSVRRPASVADPIRSGGRFLRNKFGE